MNNCDSVAVLVMVTHWVKQVVTLSFNATVDLADF